MKKLYSVRGILTVFLVITVVFALAMTWYKIAVWGFSFRPSAKSTVWAVDAHISFKPSGDPIEVSLSKPSAGPAYKILSEDTVAKGYEIIRDDKNNRILMKSKGRRNNQDLYYRIMLYDNEDSAGKVWDDKPAKVQKP